MNSNENARASAQEAVVVLGVISVDTHGPGLFGEVTGIAMPAEISED